MGNKILAVGDSLALPGHGNEYEDTWIWKLKQEFKKLDFITIFQRAMTTEVLVSLGGGKNENDFVPNGADCLEFYKPDIIILQLGIVDCAPRLFHRDGIEIKLINRLPSNIKDKYIKIVKQVRTRNYRRSYVSAESFENNLRVYLNRCIVNNLKNVILIGIPYPDNRMIEKNQNIYSAVNYYNRIYLLLEKDYSIVKVIFPLDSRKYDEKIYSDGYHPNSLGHQLIFSELKQVFKSD